MAAVGTVWEAEADTWTLHVAIATYDLGCPWRDWTHEALQGLYMVSKTGVGDKWVSKKLLGDEANKKQTKND